MNRQELREKLNVVGVEELMEFENGEMDQDEAANMFQRLINSGLAWQLQGYYGRTAQALIDAGLCEPAGRMQ